MSRERLPAGQRRWVVWFAAALAAATSLPYVLAAARGPLTFTGFLIGVDDGNSYIAKMLLGGNGDWLFHSPYSIELQSGALLYAPYLLLGKLLGAGASHGWYVLAFHAFRIASIGALCFGVYAFVSLFVGEVALRRLGLALATMGGGLSWLLLLAGRSEWLGSMPLDFYSPETFGYLAVFGLPHLALARALLLFAFVHYLTGRQIHPAATAVLWLGLALTHLITAAIGLLLIGLHMAASLLARSFKPIQLRYWLWALLGTAPVFLYNAYALLHDEFLQAWAAQNQILSPHPLHYLLAYGLLLPMAVLALHEWRPSQLRLFSLSWLIALPVLLYLPVGLQRRFAEAAWVLLVALVLRFIDSVYTIRRRWLWLLAFTLPSTLLLWLGALSAAWQAELPVQRSADEAAAFAALRAEAQPGEVVLASYSVSNALPAWAPLRVLAGHGPESVHFEYYQAQVDAFFQQSTRDAERMDILRRNNIAYVVWGPQERALGDLQPSSLDYLQPWFGVGGLQVFQVSLPLE